MHDQARTISNRDIKIDCAEWEFHPILTGLFECKFLLAVLGGGLNLTPPSDLGPRRGRSLQKSACDVTRLMESVLLQPFFGGKSFIMLLWFMHIWCIIITYLLIFPTNRSIWRPYYSGRKICSSIVNMLAWSNVSTFQNFL